MVDFLWLYAMLDYRRDPDSNQSILTKNDQKPSHLVSFFTLAGWWQLKYFLMFTPNRGEMIPILTVAYVSNWVGLKPPNKHLGFSSNHPISNP